MNKIGKTLLGICFVILRPIVTPVLWIVKYTKDNFDAGYNISNNRQPKK